MVTISFAFGASHSLPLGHLCQYIVAALGGNFGDSSGASSNVVTSAFLMWFNDQHVTNAWLPSVP